ncbi:MarR family winged helix-turn-helix transcriptional regulator [Sinimarinibacterium sp. CAU 1509]|uniref:MarR family winged helix-turn-helix transcriptional regulator n=1 Tax=Sinimarinibacterium sp. CAU 1509 TaxID=2562283 RepID=UPI00146DAFBF|nr:MarR family transcriptional regulator [Sinimarinibacterium sp. CAU 1509]
MSSHVLPLLGALRRIAQSLDSYSKAIEHSAGLTLPQLLLLEALRNETAPITAGRLADRVSLTQGTVTSILDRLEDRGLIARMRAIEDRRRVLVTLTPQGRDRLNVAPALMRDDFVRGFAALPEAEREALLAAVERIGSLMRTEPHSEARGVSVPQASELMDQPN